MKQQEQIMVDMDGMMDDIARAAYEKGANHHDAQTAIMWHSVLEKAKAKLAAAILSERKALLAKLEVAEKDNGDSISDHLQGILGSGGMCPLCGRTNMHTHSPEEIIIYRNGVKYGRKLTSDLQSALEFEQKGTDAVMKALGMEPTEGGNFNYLKACGLIREMLAKLEAAQRLRDALTEDASRAELSTALAAFDKEQQ